MRYLDRILDEDATPRRWITEQLATADEFVAVVGRLDRGGVQLLEAGLRALLERGGSVRIVVDSRSDVAWLLEFFAAYGERAVLLLANEDATLHAKVFFARGPSGRHALIGSADLTRAGLTRNWEAAVVLEPPDAEALQSVEKAIRAWLRKDFSTPAGFEMRTTPPGRNVLLGDLLLPAVTEIETAALVGAPTGVADLDNLLGGLRPGQMVVVAGCPGIGKSAFALGIARHAAIRLGLPALFLTLGTSAVDMTHRVLSAEAEVPWHALRSGKLMNDDWLKLARRMGETAQAPLSFNDSCAPSISGLAEAARPAVTDDGVKLIVVDHLQLLGPDQRAENRQIPRELKNLARSLGVPLVVLSQLDRAPEARTDKRPRLADLPDAGGVAQDADVMILVHRDDYYDEESPRAGEADLIVAKNRSGPTGTVTVAAQLHLSRFTGR